jgi:hypothetical protein
MASFNGAACASGHTVSGGRHHGETISLEPASAYEAVTRQMVIGLETELREIKSRLNGLLFMVAGSVLLEAVTRVVGDR